MNKFSETFHQSLAISTVVFNELTLGVGMGWTAPVLNALQKPGSVLPLTPDESSWIASVDHFGKMLGVLVGSALLDVTGRKPALLVSTLLFFVMWFGILFTKSVLIVCAVRLVFGFAVGLNDSTNSVYLGEVSSPTVRSVFGSIFIMNNYIGIFIEFIIATYFSYNTTAVINLVLCSVPFFVVFWLVEPAQFLLMKGKCKQAEKNFLWLKGASELSEVKDEFEQMKQNVQEEKLKKLSLKTKLTSPANYRSILIVSTVYFLTGAGGYYPIMSYASLAFSSTESLSASELTILFGVFQIIFVLPTSYANKRFNRRPMILISMAAAAFVHACTAALYYCHQHVFEVPYFSWLIFGSITTYASIYAFAYPTIFLIRAELFPLSVKAIGGCISLVGIAASSFLMTKSFVYIYINYGIYCNFLLFAIVNLLTVAFAYFLLPETKNKSLIEIQKHLEKQE